MLVTEFHTPIVSICKHDRVPLFESMEIFRQRLVAPFYCPGHKGGRSLPHELKGSLGVYDLNNLPDTDTLHCPSGPILEAEKLVADAYGVDRSFLMVGGSSLGNMAAVMAVAGPNDTILVQRNAHKSVIAGIIHSGAVPEWVLPQWDERFGIGHGLTVDALEQAIVRSPKAKALIMLNPTYFGTVADFAAIAKLCKRNDLVLIADEAHGPHFRFGQSYPIAAENAGADIVVQSTHKILSGLSQAAVLHLCSDKIDHARVQAALQALQTTSPNFAIMASIDLARRQMMQEGQSRLAAMQALAETARSKIKLIPGLDVLGPEHSRGSKSGFYGMDTTKLLIDTTQSGWSGSDAQRFLNSEYGVQPELSGPGYLLCILTLGSIQEDIDHLLRGLRAMCSQAPPCHADFTEVNDLAGRLSQRLPDTVMSPRDAFFSKHRTIPFDQALNRVSGEIITPYPPGIPVVMPGERFNQDSIELLTAVKRSRCPISAVDSSLQSVRVID